MRAVRGALAREMVERMRVTTEIARIVRDTYHCGRLAAGCLIERGEVHDVVRTALSMRSIDPMFRRRINAIVRDLGARTVLLNGRSMFRDMRLRTVSQAAAIAASSDLKRGYDARVMVNRPETPAEWEELLRSEGMPAELPMIRRESHARDEGADDNTPRPLSPTLASWDVPSARAAMTGAYYDRIGSALNAARLECAVLEGRSEGKSLRAVGLENGIDKMAVSRILRRWLGALAENNETEE